MIGVYVAEMAGNTPKDYRHPTFLVYGSDAKSAQFNAENYLIRTKNRYWKQVYIKEATPDELVKLVGEEGHHVHLLRGNLMISTQKDHMDHPNDPADIPRERRFQVRY
jgi:hypothetical protein